jgi:hypothetical protein
LAEPTFLDIHDTQQIYGKILVHKLLSGITTATTKQTQEPDLQHTHTNRASPGSQLETTRKAYSSTSPTKRYKVTATFCQITKLRRVRQMEKHGKRLSPFFLCPIEDKKTSTINLS